MSEPFLLESLTRSQIASVPERWLNAGGVEFLIRLGAPKEFDRFLKTCKDRNIAKLQPTFEILDAQRFRLEFARAFILDWRGKIDPELLPYTAEKCAQLLDNVPGLHAWLMEEIVNYQSFLGNGAGSPTSSSES